MSQYQITVCRRAAHLSVKAKSRALLLSNAIEQHVIALTCHRACSCNS